jgi:hypothetical protein
MKVYIINIFFNGAWELHKILPTKEKAEKQLETFKKQLPLEKFQLIELTQ